MTSDVGDDLKDDGHKRGDRCDDRTQLSSRFGE